MKGNCRAGDAMDVGGCLEASGVCPPSGLGFGFGFGSWILDVKGKRLFGSFSPSPAPSWSRL